jgi:SET domain-containing protein
MRSLSIEEGQGSDPIEPPAICLRSTPGRGRGVFAGRRFARGEIVEEAPVILLPEPEWTLLNRTALEHYYYSWTADADALVLGFGCFYNHCDLPNVDARRVLAEERMRYVALRDIEAGEELTIRYRCPLWFEPI